jgi:hypothetical protein
VPELTDYSSPYQHDLKWEDFSKDFLIELMQLWQWAYLRLTRFWYEEVNERCGSETAGACQLAVWDKIAERVVPRFAKLGNIEPDTVPNCLKIIQLTPDGHTGRGYLFDGDLDIKSDKHVIATTTKCRILEYFEKEAPERIEEVCHILEPQIIQMYMCNPKATVTPLKLPPRKSPTDICCQFEIKLEE